MGEKIRRFIPRAPRYVLRPPDRNVMRFGLASLKGPAHIEHTTLVNLSETGAAFITDDTTDIKIGDSVKVEIPIPNGEQIAWFARVVRIEEYEERSWLQIRNANVRKDQIIVGLKFETLPDPHTRAIRKGIERSFLKALQDQQMRRVLYYKAWFWQNVIPLGFYLLLTCAAIGFIYALSRPTDTYDGKRGAPWGERFKF
jgi:hypothetical protein